MVLEDKAPEAAPETPVQDLELRVLGDRLVIVLDDLAEEIIHKDPVTGRVFRMKIADEHSERTRLATVMAVGDDPTLEGRFRVGDRAIVSWHCGVRLHLINKTVFGKTWSEDLLRIVRKDEILALFTVKE